MWRTLRLRPLLQRTCRRARSSTTPTATATSSSTAATASESVSPFRRVIASYEVLLNTRPILTKSATGGVLYGIGDGIGSVHRASEPTNQQW